LICPAVSNCRAFADKQFDIRAQRVHAERASMHELSIMTEAVRMAVEAARAAGASKILKMRLRVGSLSGVVPDSLRFAFDVVCNGTMADGASLEIDIIAAASWCETCEAEFMSPDFFNECPRCHNVSGELRRGRELEIVDVETS